jgi:deferrochelatase/peroxidase EfeB
MTGPGRSRNGNCSRRSWWGRWRSGAPLTLADDPGLGADPRRNNDFTDAADPDGRQVPLGSHMRRMNPRDTKLEILTDVNVHRIIRRSTTTTAPS